MNGSPLLDAAARRPARPKLSAVIACYGDGPAIRPMYERLSRVFQDLGVDYEIIFVNDRSPDDAALRLRELAAEDSKVVVINHTRNFGSQSAFTSGMSLATGDGVVLMDGDLQDPPEVIPELYAKWREGYDVVYGNRVSREAPLTMRFAYKFFYRIFSKVSYVRIPPDAGDFSLMDRRVVNALMRLPESHRFIRGLRAWVGFAQIGVPYHRPERPYGRTTNSLLRNLGWARRAILSFSYAPLDLIMALAFAVVAISFVGALVEIVVRLIDPRSAPSGFTTVIVLMLFLGGVQLLCLSIIGSYLAHIYEEVKRRPPFIVDSILNDPRQSGSEPAPTAQRQVKP